MNTFIKYNSLENHYNGKYLNKIPDEYKNIPYGVTEKLDGANLQILFTPNSPYKVGRRSAFLEENESFFDVWNVLTKYKDFLDKMQVICNERNVPIRIFGELYGEGINGRIVYGDGKSKYLKFFDILIDEVYLTQVEMINFINVHSFQDNFVTTTVYPTLLEALSHDVESINAEKLTNEGIVIKPFAVNVFLYNNERLAIKKKAVAFADKMSGATNQGKIKEFDPKILNASTEFKKYITNNRMIDLFSKHGKMQNIKEMGTYIRFFIEDAKADYVKENNITEFNEKELKDVFNVGSIVAEMLKASLNEGP